MSRVLGTLVVLLASLSVIACASRPEAIAITATPVPTTVLTAAPTPTDSPTATPRPTPTTVGDRLPTIACTPAPCNQKVTPHTMYVDWVRPPRVSAGGEFSLVARIHDGHSLEVATPAPNGGRLNLHFSVGSTLYGSILPVDNTPGWSWKSKPGQWVADIYDYENRVLTVAAQINPAAATHPGLRMCLWSGGKTREETYILGCIEVEQP